MKNIFLFVFLLAFSLAKAQETSKSTNSFQITGKVKITNHSGESRGEFKRLKGALEKASIQTELKRLL